MVKSRQLVLPVGRYIAISFLCGLPASIDQTRLPIPYRLSTIDYRPKDFRIKANSKASGFWLKDARLLGSRLQAPVIFWQWPVW
jgi:hypothetical protein